MHPTHPNEEISPGRGWPALQTAWQEAQREAGTRPWLARLLRRPGKTLLARFADKYARLLSLSRQRRRALLRRAGMGLAGVALLLALGSAPVHAAEITVDGATCTLVDAIIAANTDTATGGCAAGSGADTLTLQASVILYTAYDANYNGLPPVTTEITIAGNGHTIGRNDDPFNLFRILTVEASGALTLNQAIISGGFPGSEPGGGIHNSGALTVTNYSGIFQNRGGAGAGIYNSGALVLANSQVDSNYSDYSGGAAGIANSGTLIASYSSVTGNRAGAGVTNSGAALVANTIVGSNLHGVGIVNSGTLTVTDSSIGGNNGGGIVNEVLAVATVTGSELLQSLFGSGIGNSGALAVANTVIGNNIYGPAILNTTTGVATVTDSILRNNQAMYGSGIDSSGALTVTNSTISGNWVTVGGGGIRICGGEALVRNSTISGNEAYYNNGGGISVCDNSLLTIDQSTVTGNTTKSGDGGGIAAANTSTVVVSRTLVSGNTAGFGDELFAQSAGAMTLDANNLIGHSGLTTALAMYNVTAGGSDITATSDGTDPTALADILDTTLANNGGPTFTHGGPTFTHALVTGSPAIDAAGNPGLHTDQRGVSRPQGTANDIGAFEVAPTNARINGSDCNLIDAIIAANTDASKGICNAGSGADTITLLDDVTLTTRHNNLNGPNGLPWVNTPITIEGDGFTISRDAGAVDAFRILLVTNDGDLTLNRVTISDGDTGNIAGGAGIHNRGNLTVNNSTIANNRTFETQGAGILNFHNDVGADPAVLVVNNSTISGNTGAAFGGGIYNGYGGATVIINSSAIVNNSSDTPYSGGGGLAQMAGGSITLNHTLVSGNSAPYGSELYQDIGGTITGNNFNLFGHSGLSTYAAISRFTPGATDITATSDGTDPTALAAIFNSTLADNGGPTFTHALVSGSPAIDAIPDTTTRMGRALLAASCDAGVDTDQRGVVRANGGNTGNACDIGSFEFEAAPTAVDILDFSSAANWWGDGPQLHWETGDESGLYGFHIWRGTAHKAETRLTTELIGATGGFGGSHYTWQDATSFGWGQRVYYWLEAVGPNGSGFTGPVEVWGIGRIFLPSVAR
ncbi:MAG: right-handed parallel beta-helix repeat-containing protein [Caldilineaceae bacterium]|nr:right-handed parallel beta-helix repeat-containing protein [Caldilineaceae bacterium]